MSRGSHRVHYAPLDGLATGARVELSHEAAHHVARVLRGAMGDALVVFDGQGREARGHIAELSGRGPRVVVELEEAPREGVGRDGAGVIWLQGVPKGEKLEAVVQKATELGAAEVWPVYTARSVPRPAREAGSRGERLRAVARSAAAQSGRADVPEVREPMPLATALGQLPAEAKLRIVPWEDGGEPLADVLARAAGDGEGGCVVLVGPEGGLGADEVARAREHGFVAVTLGPRTWRTETVAPALLAVLSFARGDLRPAALVGPRRG